ncbi:MAG: hypothetical protein Q7K65_05405 [Candidatus Buchananbacteria bacterium]|nr:hypothetical protein [Candidatus Buchananbacteria bacterium]
MDQLVLLIIQYKYLILFPIAAIEGPIVSLAIGFLIYLGYLDFLPAYFILILGDLIPDTVYYYIGRLGDKKNFLNKYGSRLSLASNIKILDKLWAFHPRKTMFLSKFAYGLSTPFLISAGLIKMPFRKFVSYTFPVILLQYALIMAIGYYLGQSYQIAEIYIQYTGILVAVIIVIFIVGYALFTKYARTQIIKMEQEQ